MDQKESEIKKEEVVPMEEEKKEEEKKEEKIEESPRIQLTERDKRKLRRLTRKKRISEGAIKPRPKQDTKELSLWRTCTEKITSKKSVVHKFIGPEKKINPIYEQVLKLYREHVAEKKKEEKPEEKKE